MVYFKPARVKRPISEVHRDIERELARLPLEESLRLESVWFILRHQREQARRHHEK
jgi:hypothetical protein